MFDEAFCMGELRVVVGCMGVGGGCVTSREVVWKISTCQPGEQAEERDRNEFGWSLENKNCLL